MMASPKIYKILFTIEKIKKIYGMMKGNEIIKPKCGATRQALLSYFNEDIIYKHIYFSIFIKLFHKTPFIIACTLY